MPLKILHTSDIHLGMKFAGYPEKKSELSDARFDTLAKLVEHANNEKCDLFVVAGDLFDRVTVAKSDIVRAAQILREFQGRLVVVLPGNHDFISMGQADLYIHFKENSGDNMMLLEETKVYPLSHYDLDVNLYPAPCNAKHSSENCIGWIKETTKDKTVKFHIGLAHGSLEGFSPDFDKKYYPMSASELMACGLDLWLMGHTHIQYPEKPGDEDRIFYPSTPEPDGFGCAHEGKSWILHIGDDKKIKPASLSTGTYRFLHDEIEINDASDLERLKARYSADKCSRMLLKLKLRGHLPREEYGVLREIKDAMEKLLYYLQVDDNGVTEILTPEEINKLFTERSFPHRLLTKLAEENDSEALQIAYELIKESRK